jgi:TusA-related sulfurtransferase
VCLVPREWDYDDVFDAVNQGCGDLLLELRQQIDALGDGAVLLVATRDLGSPVELPAWCRLTGNRLLAQQHPYYLVKKKSNHRKE